MATADADGKQIAGLGHVLKYGGSKPFKWTPTLHS